MGAKFVAFVVVLVTAMIGAVVRGIPRVIARRRRHEKAQAQLAAGLAEIKDGALVTLKGTVSPVGDALEAPLSGQRCVAYAATVAVGYVTRYTSREERGSSEMCAFVLDTGRERVVVEGDRAVIDAPLTPVIPEDRVRNTRYAGVEDPNAVSAPYEAVVAVGAKVVVSGRVVVERVLDGAGETGYRDEPTRARLVGSAEQPITIVLS
jgi:hypothetical protein